VQSLLTDVLGYSHSGGDILHREALVKRKTFGLATLASMERKGIFFISFLTSYLIVAVLGLLLSIRPWESDSTHWVSQHNQIWIFYLLVLQIPGVAAFVWMQYMSLFEPAFLLFAAYICGSTWRNVASDENSPDLRRLRRLTFFLLLGVLFYRLALINLLNPFVGQVGNSLDLRNPSGALSWINFESTLILTLTIVHLILLIKSRKKNLLTK
jgi:hypothetical protein